jgi:hypothetical protein
MARLMHRSRRRFLRLGFISFLAFVAIALSSPAPALGKKKKTAAPVPAELPDHVAALGRQLLSLPLDESDSVTSQIQQLVIADLQAWFDKQPASAAPSDTPSDVRVRRVMENAFSRMQYPAFGQPQVFTQSWNGGVLTGAGYTLGWSDYDRVNVVGLFETRDGKTRLAGLEHFGPYTDLHYAFLPAPGTGSFRFLAYGFRLGKSQPRLSAVLYEYDGQALKSLWETRDVYDGKMEVEKDTVTIRYLKEDEYIRELTYNRRPPRHLAVYKSSPKGLTLDSDREIPF